MKSIVFAIFALFMVRIRAQRIPGGSVILNSILKQDSAPFLVPVIPIDQIVSLTNYYPGNHPLVIGFDVFDQIGVTPIQPELIVCQAFKDDAGRYPVGKPFTKAPLGSQRISKTPVYVGSIFCSDAAAVRAYVHSRPAIGIPLVQSVPRPYVGIGFDVGNRAPQGLLTYVLSDNSVTPVTLPKNATIADIFVVSPRDDVISCQFYKDKEGTKTIAPPIIDTRATNLTTDENYAASKVKTIRCKVTGFERFIP